ncbi:hypothetical protein GWC77_25320 [Paraburkholderia sp. NMBU_R16]|uniref:hypothetical protein n=1 Tax=Paraburkholderia sp. NMBU_R16 TaxID=2698676 RepID=UPI001567C55A|nr:hypothetical protein [Paraburkholderia sp. NMBU_R16]NRO99219.1 hypothetical protein [Paraburkholderia sp. NMBU_R16]
MIPKFSIRGTAGREITKKSGDADAWDALVSRVLGPVVTDADRERRRGDALALAAAALRAAGEKPTQAGVLA